jgi:hypothetical protein
MSSAPAATTKVASFFIEVLLEQGLFGKWNAPLEMGFPIFGGDYTKRRMTLVRRPGSCVNQCLKPPRNGLY